MKLKKYVFYLVFLHAEKNVFTQMVFNFDY